MQGPADGAFSLIEFFRHGFYLLSKAAGIDIDAKGFTVFEEFLQAVLPVLAVCIQNVQKLCRIAVPSAFLGAHSDCVSKPCLREIPAEPSYWTPSYSENESFVATVKDTG